MESGDPFLIIDALASRKVPFVIIGGHAVNYHGYLRATEDTDIVVRKTPDVEQALLTALRQVNAHWIGDEIRIPGSSGRLLCLSNTSEQRG